MIYGDDQCEECGAVRVAGSKLCGDCLVKRLRAETKKLLIKKAIIWGQEMRITNLEAMLKEATAYGYKKNQENTKLYQHIKGLQQKLWGVMEDEKNRVHCNT
jgi:hypothetical protein